MAKDYRRAVGSAGEYTTLSPLLHTQHLHDHALRPLAIKLRVKHSLPRPKIKLSLGHRQGCLVVQQQRFQMRIAIVLTGPMVLLIRTRWRQFLEPFADVLN